MRRVHHQRCRGTAGVATILTLVILQLAIVSIVVAGARDVDIAQQRLDTARAFYAAEAGLSMCMREVMSGADEDGDGTIGTISNDGNSANDPALGSARFSVSSSTSAGQTTFDTQGRAGLTGRHMQTVLDNAPGAGGGGSGQTLVYGDTTTNIPRVRTWSGSSWSSEGATLDIGGSPRWVMLRSCPTRSELMAAVVDNQDDVNLMSYSSGSWGHLTEVATNLGGNADRRCYMAYEQLSGDALVVYRVGSTTPVYYRTWNGTAWSAENSTASLTTGSATWMKLVPKPGSNEIMLLALDNNKDLQAMVWDGSAFGNKVTLTTAAIQSGVECIAAAYESLSGRCIVGWGDNTTPCATRIWTGSVWQSGPAIPSVQANLRWLRLAPDPVSDKIIAASLDGSVDIDVSVWNGSSWTADLQIASSCPAADRRGFDVAFEPAGTRALIVYAQSSQNAIRYRTYDGSAWSAEQIGTDIGEPASVVQFAPSASGHEILCGIERKNNGALAFLRWTGSAFADFQILISDMGGPNGNECFMFSDLASATPRPTIASCAEIER